MNTHSEVEREVRTLSSSYPCVVLFVSGYELDDSSSVSGRDFHDQTRSDQIRVLETGSSDHLIPSDGKTT